MGLGFIQIGYMIMLLDYHIETYLGVRCRDHMWSYMLSCPRDGYTDGVDVDT